MLKTDYKPVLQLSLESYYTKRIVISLPYTRIDMQVICDTEQLEGVEERTNPLQIFRKAFLASKSLSLLKWTFLPWTF